MKAAAVVAASVALTLALTGCTGRATRAEAPATPSMTTSSAATGAAASGVVIRIIPDATTAKAGDAVPATIGIENHTGHAVQFSNHACDGNVAAGLESDTVAFTAAWAAAACAPWSLPTSGTEYRTALATTYTSCVSAAGDATTTSPPCDGRGRLPALPPGAYRTTAAWIGIAAPVTVVDPVTITLTR